MAHFQLIDAYPLGTANGGCYLCGEGGTVDGPKVDTGMVISFEGGLVFCGACVAQIAQLVGFVDRKFVDEAVAAAHELQRVADEAVRERAETKAVADMLWRRMAALGSESEPEPAKPAGKPRSKASAGR